jgi:hypothetical protein
VAVKALPSKVVAFIVSVTGLYLGPVEEYANPAVEPVLVRYGRLYPKLDTVFVGTTKLDIEAFVAQEEVPTRLPVNPLKEETEPVNVREPDIVIS